MTTIEHGFDFGDVVYLRMAGERRPGMVTGYLVNPMLVLMYRVAWGDATETMHYEIELTGEYVPDFAREDAC
jgi:hypothetical protein